MRTSTNRRLLNLIGAGFLAFLVACSWLAPLDNLANNQVDAGLKRAAATYASARLINGVISVIQGTQVSAAPAGMGMTFSPGEILDPLNDLVEQFSEVMLIAMVAFGVEKVLLTIGASWMISAALTCIAACWVLFRWGRGTSPDWLSKALVAFLVLRFAMPVSLTGTEAIFQNFMASNYKESQTVLSSVHVEAIKFSQTRDDSQSVWTRFKNFTAETVADARSGLENLQHVAENAIERVINLIVIFVLETILLPIFIAWALLRTIRTAFLRSSTWRTPGTSE